jgi:hypothetical protein
MYHDYTYQAVLASSLRAQWELDDVLGADQELDFSRKFMPDSLCGTAAAPGLADDNERRMLNQIAAFQYLCYFGAVEEFILPFLLDHARPMLCEDDYRVRALLNFASEEAKHIHLFNRYHDAFVRGFPVTCYIVGPREVLTQMVLSHHPLAAGLIILMIEWMTQAHYLGSIRDDGDIDPLFKSLFKHHWMEEAQHAKLDTLIVDALAEDRSEPELARVTNEFFQIASFLDKCLEFQARFNVEALERGTGRKIAKRETLIVQQYRAARWTYLGSGMDHDRFKATLEAISPKVAARVAAVVAQNRAAPEPRRVAVPLPT